MAYSRELTPAEDAWRRKINRPKKRRSITVARQSVSSERAKTSVPVYVIVAVDPTTRHKTVLPKTYESKSQADAVAAEMRRVDKHNRTVIW